MLPNLFAIFFWYGIGWVGAILFLCSFVYTTDTIYRKLSLEEIENWTNKFRTFVAKAYEWVGIDWCAEPIETSYIPLRVATIMAFIAMFGTFAFAAALVTMFILFGAILIWTKTKKHE